VDRHRKRNERGGVWSVKFHPKFFHLKFLRGGVGIHKVVRTVKVQEYVRDEPGL
jgi:hypothetical protein